MRYNNQISRTIAIFLIAYIVFTSCSKRDAQAAPAASTSQAPQPAAPVTLAAPATPDAPQAPCSSRKPTSPYPLPPLEAAFRAKRVQKEYIACAERGPSRDRASSSTISPGTRGATWFAPWLQDPNPERAPSSSIASSANRIVTSSCR